MGTCLAVVDTNVPPLRTMDGADTCSHSSFGKGAGGTPGTTQRGTGCLRFLQWLLFLLLLGFLAYQCWVIYLPAMRSAINPTFKPKFPAYTYSVWGKKFNGLNVAEPWVILVVSIVVLIFTAKCVVLKGPPISSSPGGAKLEEKED